MIYELHITVNSKNIEQFKKDCSNINVKPIVIDTQKGEVQVMTSSQHNNNFYIETLNDIKNKLIGLRYDILRCKVEIKPENIKHHNFIYYESHLRLKLPKIFDSTLLKQKCKESKFHFSKNLFKSDIDYNYQMITYRDYKSSFFEFNNIINNMKTYLNINNIDFDKIEIEECILDTNTSVDKNWLTN